MESGATPDAGHAPDAGPTSDGEHAPDGGHAPEGPGTAGHRIVSHTADLALEAWAPSREDCLTEAVRALVDSVAEPTETAAAEGDVTFAVAPGTPDEDLLVAVLDEAIYQMEVHERLPVDVSLHPEAARTADRAAPGAPAPDAALEVRFATVPARSARVVGAMPKAVSLHELRFAATGGIWSCHVTVDV
jgi:SHS2 domain-containing protein